MRYLWKLKIIDIFYFFVMMDGGSSAMEMHSTVRACSTNVEWNRNLARLPSNQNSIFLWWKVVSLLYSLPKIYWCQRQSIAINFQPFRRMNERVGGLFGSISNSSSHFGANCICRGLMNEKNAYYPSLYITAHWVNSTSTVSAQFHTWENIFRETEIADRDRK